MRSVTGSHSLTARLLPSTSYVSAHHFCLPLPSQPASTHPSTIPRCVGLVTEGSKLDLFIASDRFNGVKLLDRHRLINDIVTQAGLFEHIHALTIKAWTVEEWEKKKDNIPQTVQADQQLATSPH